jgi:hypothetical protein
MLSIRFARPPLERGGTGTPTAAGDPDDEVKVGLLELAKQLGNVSQACKVMGYSRDKHSTGQALLLARAARDRAPLSAGCLSERRASSLA